MVKEKGTSIDQECIDDAEEITNRLTGKLVFDSCYNGLVSWDRYKPFYLASRRRGNHGQ